MRTLEEFQKEVLAPLRKERDDKQKEAHIIKNAAGTVSSAQKKDLLEKEKEFADKQKAALKDFMRQQAVERKKFKIEQAAVRAKIHATYQFAVQEEKMARRRANEEFMDKISVAFHEYNMDRVAAGEQPISYYEKSCEILAKERKAGYDENGWPEDPTEAEA